jgi:2-oxo-3-hexenedioate decarboxylase
VNVDVLHLAQPDEIAREVLAALDERRQLPPLSNREPITPDRAYRITAAVRRLREQRGERVVGRKIGFTNESIWPEYGVHAPIWGYVYDTTLHRLADLSGPFDMAHLVEPRIEPEVMFGLARRPEAGMNERALLSCIDWVAHGFEIVQSLFPGWRFRAADTIAAFGLHGALFLGEPQAVTPENADAWLAHLASFEISLLRGGVEADRGRASNVLGGGPVAALRRLIELLAQDPASPPLGAGEIISTGTLTRAWPMRSGETWSTRLNGVPLDGAALATR